MFPALDERGFDLYRHERTEQYLATRSETYSGASVTFYVETDAISTYAGQFLTILTTNLALRLFRHVRVRLGADASLDAKLCRPGLSTVRGRLESEAWGADPFADPFGRDVERSFVVHLCRRVADAPPPDLVVGSDGWIAQVSRSGCGIEPDRRDIIVGPALAACIAVAELLKATLGFDSTLRANETRVSLWDFSTGTEATQGAPPRTVELGKVLMVGAGAVASNLAYLMHATDVRAELDVVDHDVVKGLNLDRSALFGVPWLGWNKAEVVAILLNERMRARAHPCTYDEYVRRFGRTPNGIDLLLPLANEFGVRWAIANSVPPLSIYGTTRGDWGANLGRHIPLVEPCLGCRFGDAEEQPTFVCATGSLDERPSVDGSTDAALPFLSMGAAVLALSEMQKLAYPGYPVNHAFVDLDFKGPFTHVSHHRRSFRRPCACSSVSRELFGSFNGSSRFASYSLASV